MPKQLTEAGSAPAVTAPGRIKVGLITPGWGSSGHYSPKVIENAATDKVWPKGTHIYFDHPSESEMYERPERSVRDLAAILDEDAYWDGSQLVAEAKVIGPYRDLITDPVFVEAVGMSIRAAGDTTIGEAEGRKGTIITRLTEGISVDLVTRAGRGGKVLQVIESARADLLAEANAEDTHQAIQRAVRTAYATTDGEGRGWLRDFDPDLNLAFIQVSGELIQRTYELNTDGTATLQPDAVRVTARTIYTPIEGSQNSDTTSVPAPVGQSPATESRKDNTMATTQIEESELGRLREDAGRVQALESERDTAVRERDQARQELAESQRRIAARTVIEAQASEHDVTFSPLEERGLLASLPLTENGEFDEAAFTETVTAEAARKAEASGAGSVRGFGSSTKVTESKTTSDTNAWDDIDTHLGISKEA